MTENSQIQPLSPYQLRSDEEELAASRDKSKELHQRKHMLYCIGFCMAAILILAVLIIVLMLTVFRIHDPEIKMNRITIPQLSLNAIPSTIHIVAEFAVKNPNAAAFRYDNSTIFLYFEGKVVGEAHIPAGISKARRTRSMNVSMEIVPAKVFADPKFVTEFGSGVLTVSSYTRLDGRVKIIKIIKKHVVVKMNCTIKANVTSQQIVDQKCESKVSA